MSSSGEVEDDAIDDNSKKRRKRTIITAEQLDKLETSFRQEPWPNRVRKIKLARELGKGEQFINIWFQNKRARAKREEEMMKTSVEEARRRKIMEGKKVPIAKRHSGKANSMLAKAKGHSSSSSTVPVEDLGKVHAVDLKVQATSFDLDSHTKGKAQPKHTRKDYLDAWKSAVKSKLSETILQKKRAKNDSDNDDKYEQKPKLIVSGIGNINKMKKTSRAATVTTSSANSGGICATGKIGDNARKGDTTSTSGGIQQHHPQQWQISDDVCRYYGQQMIDPWFDPYAWQQNVYYPYASYAGVPIERTSISETVNYSTASLSSTSPACNSQYTPGEPVSLFRAIINMVAVSEGGIMSVDDPEFPQAANDSLYGILINDSCRLVYDKEYGLEFVDFIDD